MPPSTAKDRNNEAGTTQTVRLSDLYAAAADDMANRRYVLFQAGPDVWATVHMAVHDLVTAPLVEGLRRRLRLPQVQHWRTDQDTVVATLRELAADPEPLDVLQSSSAEHRIAEARRLMREALGLTGDDDSTVWQLADHAAHKIRLLEEENQGLKNKQKARPATSQHRSPTRLEADAVDHAPTGRS